MFSRRSRSGGHPQQATRTSPALGVASAAVLALVAACSASPTAETGRRAVHADGKGPLSASIGDGGNSLDAPQAKTWTGTFGGFVLCSLEPDTRIVVQRVRYRESIEPQRVVPIVRTTTPQRLRRLTPTQRSAYLPVYAALGSPPRFAEPYANAVLPGQYSTAVRGWTVDQSCRQTRATETQLTRGRIPSHPLKELLFAVTVGPRGGQILQVDIDYLAGNRPMTLELPWAMVACGTAISDPDAC